MATTTKAGAAAKTSTPKKAAAAAATKTKPAAKPKTPATDPAPKKAAAKSAAPKAAKSASVAPKRSAVVSQGVKIGADRRRHYVEVAAYYIAERRGFIGGNAADDWKAAEEEINRLLAEGKLRG